MKNENSKDRQMFQMQKEGFDVIAKNLKNNELVKVITPISKLAEAILGENKAKDGHTPTDEELLALIKPLIPEVTPAKDGHTPTEEELLALIKPLIPKVKNGETPSDERLLGLIKPLIPKIDVSSVVKEASEIVKELIPERETPDEVVEKLQTVKRPWLSIEAIDGDFNTKVTKQFGGGNTRPLDLLVNGTNYGGVREVNFVGNAISAEIVNGVMTVTVSDSGGSGFTKETPTGTVNGVNTTFTVTSEPNYIVSDGITYFDGAGYTYSALSIELDSPPVSYIRSYY